MSDPATVLPPPPPPPTSGGRPSRPRNGLGLAALLVGVLAVLCSVVPFASYGAWLVGIVAIVLGIIAVIRAASGRPKRSAVIGIVLGAVAVILSIVMSIVYTAIFLFGVATDRGTVVTLGPSAPATPVPTATRSAAATGEPTPDSLATGPSTGTGGSVVYSLTGSGSARNITYISLASGGAGTDQLATATLPWSKQVALGRSTAILSLVAQTSGSGSLTCTIAVNGTVIQTNTVSGANAVVACSGTTG